jgi:glycosyltransferase 2 family protein
MLFAKLPQNEKLENRLLLPVEYVEAIGVAGSLMLLAQSIVIWVCEGMIFVSAAQAIGLDVGRAGPWQAVSVANLSYLIPSSPGAIGTFEWAVKAALVSHGAAVCAAALYGLAKHAWLLISVTGAGGVLFLLHRARIHDHSSLVKEIEMLLPRCRWKRNCLA